MFHVTAPGHYYCTYIVIGHVRVVLHHAYHTYTIATSRLANFEAICTTACPNKIRRLAKNEIAVDGFDTGS
jgi:hypothetical protein